MANCREARTRSLTTLGVLVVMASVLTTVAAQEEAPPAPLIEPVGPPSAPEILRGSVAPLPPAVEPAAGSDTPQIVGGDRVWFVDRDTGRLTGCRLINTSYVATQAIRCTERRLPRGALIRD